MGESEQSLLKSINHYQSGLERYLQRQDEEKMLHNLSRLRRLPIKLSHLEKTGVGRTVNSLRKVGGEVGEKAKNLVSQWKEVVVQEEKKDETSSSEDNEEVTHKKRDSSSHKHDKKSERRHESLASKDLKENRHKKRVREESSSSSESDDKESSRSKKKYKPDNYKEKQIEKSNKDSHRNSKAPKHSIGNESQISTSKHKKEREREDSCDKKRKHKTIQHTKEEFSEKNGEHKYKEQHSRKDKKKHHKDHNEKHDKHKKDKERKSESKDTKKVKSSSEGNSQKNKNEDQVVKTSKVVSHSLVINGIGSESGTSFADALGMCDPTISKKRKSQPQHEKLGDSSPPSFENEFSGCSPPLPKVPLENMDLNISNLLPTITPFYRPLGLPIEPPKKILTEDEALNQVMKNKNPRTKVFSGNRVGFEKVPSLFDICVNLLQNHLDALEYTGGIPYEIIKPILEKATPQQLSNMEYYNAYLIGDTDELWKRHCQKEFQNKSQQEMETWRDTYIRCLNEREAKLKALTANIKQSQDNSLPVRKTKLAYVDSIAKPPRNIARKQQKNDTCSVRPSAKLVAIATKGEGSKIAVPNPGARASERSSMSQNSQKPKKAPLMAKTISLFKNRFRR